MEFFTKYNYKKVASLSGAGKVPVYTSMLDRNGKTIVVPKTIKNKEGKKEQVYDDIYSKIQASAESVDIKTILKKFTATGDESILQTNPGVFIDTTEFPTDPITAINLLNQQKQIFNKLPAEVKQKFNNNINEYLAQAGTNEFFAKLGYKDLDKNGVVTKEEVAKQTNYSEKKEGEVNE